MFAVAVSTYPTAPHWWGEVELLCGTRAEMATAVAYLGISVMKDEEDPA